MCIRTLSVGVNRDGAFGNAVHTALSFPLVGEDVLITGAGPIGLMAAAVARHVGARFVVVTDVSDPRLAMLGLPSAPIDVDWAKVVTHIITITGIYGREMFETWVAMSAMLQGALDEIRAAGLFKNERRLTSAQSSHITTGGAEVLNFCANNYLGLANHPGIVSAAQRAMDDWGFGLASVRFICGTQELHVELEARVSEFLGTEDTTLFSSCFDANGGVFETLFGAEDAIISDELNHASIIDGIRLCKAQRFRYKNRDMADLEAQLIAAKGARQRLIVTDGVFSMDGYLAPLQEICDLADRYGALVMVDDAHRRRLRDGLQLSGGPPTARRASECSSLLRTPRTTSRPAFAPSLLRARPHSPA